MQVLKEIIHIVNRNKIKSMQLLGKADRKLDRFYDAVADKKINTDQEAIDLLYDGNPGGSTYRKLKAGLKDQLINHLFLIDVKQASYNDRQRAYYECYKDWAATKILLGKNAWEASMSISKKVLRYALKYEFTSLALDIAKVFRLYHSSKTGDVKEYEHYKKLCRELNHIDQQEELVMELYSDLVINYVNNKSSKEEIYSAALACYKQIQPILADLTSYNIQLYGGLIQLSIHASVHDYKATLKTCNEMIRIFESKPYEAKTPLQIWYYQQLICHRQLRSFEQGKASASKCLKYLEKGTFNWFKFYEEYFVLCMHTHQFEEARDIFQGVVKHKRFEFLPPNIIELWKINEAYLNLVSLSDEKLDYVKHSLSKEFRIGKFLNETNIFSKDKKGMNVSILIAQILFLIVQKRHHLLIDKMEAIDKYCVRYLKEENTMRSYYFIKLLLLIPQNSFVKERIERQADKYLQRLTAFPIHEANQSHKLEIIPYEDLWTFTLGQL